MIDRIAGVSLCVFAQPIQYRPFQRKTGRSNFSNSAVGSEFRIISAESSTTGS
jgi:hypothetical protein